MNRRDFTRALTASTWALSAAAQAPDGFFRKLVQANDDAAAAAVKDLESRNTSPRMNIRRIGSQIESLTAAYCCPESAHHRSEKLIPALETGASILVSAQHPDGTIDAGNLNSPPDTGFVIQTVSTALAVLRKDGGNAVEKTRETLKQFILAAAKPLATGGVHTPNHRWVICSALARVNSLFPSKQYVDRIDDWLDEGIYIDADGQFPERSTGIYSRVEDNAFITMARLLNRPHLLDPVRKNLEMTAYYTHPDGEIETIGSRRQDQNMVAFLAGYYPEYRFMANHDKNGLFAAVARMLETQHADRLMRGNLLIEFLEEPLLKAPLPETGSVPSSYAKVFSNTGIARIRRNDVSATVYGGSDWPLGIASGLASNPTFFTFRKGKAILESIRMGGVFFSEGAFRSEGLKAEGNRYELHQRFDVPYYQPLPKSERNARGDYKLTPAADARFWSKLNFPRRQVSYVQTLDQKVSVIEDSGRFNLNFDISGHERVPFIVELAFRPGGKLEGDLVERAKDRTYLLKSGTGRYTVGSDTIEFGPGSADHEYLDLSGSSYTAHATTLRTNGLCVYITGFTPFRRTVSIRA